MRRLSLLTAVLFLITISISYAQDDNETLGTGAGASLDSGDNNTFIGDWAGNSVTNGLNNSFLGTEAGFKQISASDNTFVGRWAGYENLYGTDNTFIGKRAGYMNTATDNTFVGTEAGESNTTGVDNTFVGEEAGNKNISGDENSFFGEDAGFNNTIGSYNTFLGSSSGRTNSAGYQNTGVGNEALYNLDNNSLIPHHNTAVGDSSGYDNNGGNFNAYFGAGSGAQTEFSDYNTFIGVYSGFNNNADEQVDDANRNTYVGAWAGQNNQNGEDNAGLGAYADFLGTNHSRNAFVGAASSVNADDAVLMGYNASVTDDNSVAIGSGAAVSGQNSMALGYASSVAENNTVYLGNGAVVSIGGIVNWTATSDGRFKTNVTEDIPGIDFIEQLRAVSYNLDVNALYDFQGADIPENLKDAVDQNSKTRHSGFIAQEVEDAAKATGYDFSGVDRPDDESSEIYGLRYAEFVVPLVKAVQELNQTVNNQQAVIDTQNEMIARYQQTLDNLEYRISEIELITAEQESGSSIQTASRK